MQYFVILTAFFIHLSISSCVMFTQGVLAGAGLSTGDEERLQHHRTTPDGAETRHLLRVCGEGRQPIRYQHALKARQIQDKHRRLHCRRLQPW